jgi:hypothetical protein
MPHAIAGRVKRVATAMARNIVRTSPTPREPRLANQAAANGKVAANAAKIKADQRYPFMILFRSRLLPMASPLPRPAPHSGLNQFISMPARKTPCPLQPEPFLFWRQARPWVRTSHDAFVPPSCALRRPYPPVLGAAQLVVLGHSRGRLSRQRPMVLAAMPPVYALYLAAARVATQPPLGMTWVGARTMPDHATVEGS